MSEVSLGEFWRTTSAEENPIPTSRHSSDNFPLFHPRRASLSARPVPASSARPAPSRPAPSEWGNKVAHRGGRPRPERSRGVLSRRQRRAMASEELAQKLQRRLQLEESGAAAEGEVEAVKGAVEDAEERSCLTASAGAELSAKLCRRQDINEGAAQPRRAAVFNPYTEFKEFSRRQIKDMERMFRL